MLTSGGNIFYFLLPIQSFLIARLYHTFYSNILLLLQKDFNSTEKLRVLWAWNSFINCWISCFIIKIQFNCFIHVHWKARGSHRAISQLSLPLPPQESLAMTEFYSFAVGFLDSAAFISPAGLSVAIKIYRKKK